LLFEFDGIGGDLALSIKDLYFGLAPYFDAPEMSSYFVVLYDCAVEK
jgi:hypothetical protein